MKANFQRLPNIKKLNEYEKKTLAFLDYENNNLKDFLNQNIGYNESRGQKKEEIFQRLLEDYEKLKIEKKISSSLLNDSIVLDLIGSKSEPIRLLSMIENKFYYFFKDNHTKFKTWIEGWKAFVESGQLQNAYLEFKEVESFERLDHGVLNVPLSKRGNIDKDIDKYKEEEAKKSRKEEKERRSSHKENRQIVKGIQKDHGKELIKFFHDKWKSEGHSKEDLKELKKTITDFAVWEPKKYIFLYNEFQKSKAEPKENKFHKLSDELKKLLNDINGNSLEGSPFNGLGEVIDKTLKAISQKHNKVIKRNGILDTILMLKTDAKKDPDSLIGTSLIAEKYIEILKEYIKEKSKPELIKNSGQGKKLIKSSNQLEEAGKPIKSLNKFIEKSDLDVFTRRNSKGGKYLSFRETVSTWEADSKEDCKLKNPGMAVEDCQIEYLTLDQPEYCLMGNPRSCVKRSTIKLIRSLKAEREKENNRIYDQEKEDYLSQFDKLTKEEIQELRKQESTFSDFETGEDIILTSKDYNSLSTNDKLIISEEIFNEELEEVF